MKEGSDNRQHFFVLTVGLEVELINTVLDFCAASQGFEETGLIYSHTCDFLCLS